MTFRIVSFGILLSFSMAAKSECQKNDVLRAKQFVLDFLTKAVMDKTDGCNRLTPSSNTLAQDVYACDSALAAQRPTQGPAATKFASASEALSALKKCVGQAKTGYVPEPCKLERGKNPKSDTLSKNIDACTLAVGNSQASEGFDKATLIAALKDTQSCQGNFDQSCGDKVSRLRQKLVEAYAKVKAAKPLPALPQKPSPTLSNKPLPALPQKPSPTPAKRPLPAASTTQIARCAKSTAIG